MNPRREFIKTTLAAGAAAVTLPSLSLAAAATAENGAPDLITVKGENRAAMLDRALQAYGGIGAFVKKGQKVVIKPNMGWDVPPERCANTHPDVVARLIGLCLGAGASEVVVFDHTCDAWERAYETSGIESAARKAGARVLPGHDESYYREVAIARGVALKKVKIHTAILDSDVFINAPVLKHHGGATMTACMKNLMGMIWDRGAYHRNNLHQCIADILTVKKPDLNILDAFSPMTRNGPRGRSDADLDQNVRQLLVSTDIVAIDAAASRLLGHAADGIDHVRIAAAAGIGQGDLGKLKIERVKLTA
ncbi:MAG: DUF362 domain-containing protein [Candidatus Accumulibacter sp.]|jgi:uncharacterized protein (DUF362 family)|nr:DUF362 domain-containing protein [Accumulibacter sp.]